jgi:cold shock CspA family protein
MIGKVVWFDVKKGWGFIRSNDFPQDIFVHYSKIKSDPGEFRVLEEGDVVEFEVFEVERGQNSSKPQAKDVKLIETNGGDNDETLRQGPDI